MVHVAVNHVTINFRGRAATFIFALGVTEASYATSVVDKSAALTLGLFGSIAVAR